MQLTYSRAAQKDKRWDVTSDGWLHSVRTVLTIRREGVVVGTAKTLTTWKAGTSLRGRRWQSSKFRHDWELDIAGKRWNRSGLIERSRILQEIREVLEKGGSHR